MRLFGALARIRRGLFTAEDPFNFHKVFGIPCLCHFLYRSVHIITRPMDDMGFDASLQTAGLFCMHAMLSLSSLVFRLPARRIKEGSRIWPEFRLHSIIFAMRAFSCLMLYWYERRNNVAPMYWVNVVIVFATLIAADVATHSVPPISRSNTIRGLDTSAA